MAKNKNCPLQDECERKCQHIGDENNCDYYRNNNVEQSSNLSDILNPSFDDYEDVEDIDDVDESIFVYTEKVTGEIVHIPVELLHNHHSNPRKDLGDISELTESIKAKGILQNLTVVPFWFELTGVGEDRPEEQAKLGYLVVIGNRRLAAAKKAGLTHLPCIISDMTPEEQFQTMLIENMQRQDLTVYEQAKGFQTMLDFGFSAQSIAEKTGFSESTVRRRLKMAELDADTLKKVSDRQLSLGDFDRLSEIQDIKLRDKVLNHIGTNNFDSELLKAITSEKRQNNECRWREAFERLGVKEVSYNEIYGSRYDYVSPGYFALADDESNFEKIMVEGAEYCFAILSSFIYFRKLREENTDEGNEGGNDSFDREENEREERYNALKEAFGRAGELRKAFVKNATESVCKKNVALILTFIVQREVKSYSSLNAVKTVELLDLQDTTKMSYEECVECLKENASTHPYTTLLAMAFIRGNPTSDVGCFDYRGAFDDDDISYKPLKEFYKLLCALGYEMSDEECQLMDGTSDLYLKED